MEAKKILRFFCFHTIIPFLLQCSLQTGVRQKVVYAVQDIPGLSFLCCFELAKEQAILHSHYCEIYWGLMPSSKYPYFIKC